MKPTAAQVKRAKKDILELDDSHGLLRENWLAATEVKKAKYMKLIDKMLDERLLLMAARDGTKLK